MFHGCYKNVSQELYKGLKCSICIYQGLFGNTSGHLSNKDY